MTMVREEYAKLEIAVSDIATKVVDALNDQEKQFLSAYRTSCDIVQAKVKLLKQEIEEKEKAICDHVKVREIERERDWYRQEALKLDKALSESQKRESEFKERLEEVSSDRRWLSEQVKLLTRRKAILEEKLSSLQSLDEDR
jgi:predicted HicB family RNase H-like nuclease